MNEADNSRIRVLITRLSDKDQESIGSTLRKAGYSVQSMRDHNLFKSTLEHEFFNLILMDHVHSLHSEEDLLSYVKSRYPSTLVILLSEQADLEEAIQCIRRGAYDYLVLPVDEKKLLNVVRSSLERQQKGLRHKAITRSLEEKVIHLQQLNQRMAALYKIIRDTRGLPTLDDSIHKVLEYLHEAVDLQCGLFILLNENCDNVILKQVHGAGSPLVDRVVEILSRPTDSIRHAFMDERNIDEVSRQLERLLAQSEIDTDLSQNMIVCPLIIMKKLYGYLCLVNPDRPPYTFADRQMLSIIASQAVSICEENHSLNQSSQLMTMGNLTAELAHDIKTPLANIKGILQTLEMKWEDENFRADAWRMINEEFNRATDLTSELLSFARTQELEVRYCNVHELIEKALRITRNTLAKSSIRLEKKFCGEALMIWVNENEVVDAFANIIINAAQAMQGGGALTVATRVSLHKSGRSSRERHTSGRYAQIEFTDTGCGMTPWELDRIFERFYTTKNDGTGLGLSMVDRVIKKYQGFIDVKSAKDEGTSFYINIPQR